ncbi:hypothetical protein QBC43DRAFT_363052, partial [Cladorrhinum sp. PSN259]
MAWSLATTLAYIHRVGGLSLPCLLLGGGMLMAFGINVLAGENTDTSYQDNLLQLPRVSSTAFRVGSQLDVQFWLAVLGASFGLLSYGLSGTYTHLFDLWCTHRAGTSPGLNYARYLNSQPRASWFGFRGFWLFTLLQHLVTVLGIIASVGYKFAVVQVSGYTVFHVDETKVSLQIPLTEAFLRDGSPSPWLGDMNVNRGNLSRAFTHIAEMNSSAPKMPLNIVMTGQADCKGFGLSDIGELVTLEVVMVANHFTEALDSSIREDEKGWTLVERTVPGWLENSQQGVTVGYRVGSLWVLEIQLAEKAQSPVVQSFKYNMSLAIAEVRRDVHLGGCSHIQRADLLTHNFGYSTGIYNMHINHSSEMTFPNKPWISAAIQDQTNGLFEGLGVIIRSAMLALAPSITALSGYSIGHAPDAPGPWGFQWNNHNSRAHLPDYPYYQGVRVSSRAGSYEKAAWIFITLSIIAYLLAASRLYVGPAQLTSWMGQHVYLALEGRIQRDGSDKLACGRQPARDLGTLRI